MTIVKVQIPLFSTAEDAPALVYAMGRDRMAEQSIPEEARAALGEDKRGYFEAKWQKDRRGWSIGRRVDDQPW